MTAVAVVELLLIVLVLPFAVLARVFGRHWVVGVRADHQPVWEIDAGGWDEQGADPRAGHRPRRRRERHHRAATTAAAGGPAEHVGLDG